MLPETQTAALVQNPGPDAYFQTQTDFPVPQISDGQVLVKLLVAGLCHSDLNRVYGPLPLINPIVGHEGVGYVVKVAENAPSSLLNQRVGLGWLSHACLHCEICEVDYTCCPRQRNLGRDLAGTFQQYVAVSAQFVHPIPETLSSEEAAPLLCAGITMYSALNKAGLEPGQWLLVPGAGGGLGHLGIQMAVARGLKVIAVDTSTTKRHMCLELGAVEFIDFRTEDVVKETARLTGGYGAHGVICSSGTTAAYRVAIQSLRNMGTLVCIGVSSSDLPVSGLDMVRRGLKLVGSAVGTRAEMQEMLALGAAGKFRTIKEVVDFDALDEVAKKLEMGHMAGRVVVRIPE